MNSVEKLSHKIAAFLKNTMHDNNVTESIVEADIVDNSTTMEDSVFLVKLESIVKDRNSYSAMQRSEAKTYIDEIKELYYEWVFAKPRLFVDMDGTLAVFKKVDTLETLYEKNYFLSLEPQMNVVDAVKYIIEDNADDIEVFILSSVLSDSKYALAEKNAWLDRYLPEIDMQHRIFPPCGEDKKDYIPKGLRTSDCLLDDYTKNLVLWCPPAQAIKLLNGINHTRGTWKGYKLSAAEEAENLADDIVSIAVYGRGKEQADTNSNEVDDDLEL